MIGPVIWSRASVRGWDVADSVQLAWRAFTRRGSHSSAGQWYISDSQGTRINEGRGAPSIEGRQQAEAALRHLIEHGDCR